MVAERAQGELGRFRECGGHLRNGSTGELDALQPGEHEPRGRSRVTDAEDAFGDALLDDRFQERNEPPRHVFSEAVVQDAALGAVHQVRERGSLGLRADIGEYTVQAEQLVDGRRCSFDARRRVLDDRVCHALNHREDGIVLGVEVEVEGALRDANRFDDCLLYTSPSPRD